MTKGDLIILVSSLCAYLELSKHCLKLEKESKRFLLVSGARKLLPNHFCIFKQRSLGLSGYAERTESSIVRNFWQ
jgi:hypothetical protein